MSGRYADPQFPEVGILSNIVENGEPIALGVIPIGDALMHSNPIVGRGCSLAWISAFGVADALREQPDDVRALIEEGPAKEAS